MLSTSAEEARLPPASRTESLSRLCIKTLFLFMECNVIHLPFCSRGERVVISYASLAAGTALLGFYF